MANDPTAIRTSTFSIGGTDQTLWTESIEVGFEAASVEFNDLSTGWTRRDVGIKNGTFSTGMFENDDGDFTAQIFDKVGDGTAYAMIVRPTSAAVGVGNPQSDFNAHITSWGLSISASDGSRHTVSYAVDGAITKSTS